ncbi:DUF4752 family protein [Escherichia coli]|nr:DUF4752 family protein [Escherichia coli]
MFSHPVYLFLREFSLQDFRGGSFLQVLLIWFYLAYRSGQWIVSVACSKGWRWWNRKNKKALALDSFYEAFNLNSLQPGSVVVVTTQSGMTIQIHKPKEEGRG